MDDWWRNKVKTVLSQKAGMDASFPACILSRSGTSDCAADKAHPSSNHMSLSPHTRTDELLHRSTPKPPESWYLIYDIGAGTLDPFHMYPSALPPKSFNSYIAYSKLNSVCCDYASLLRFV